MIDNLIPVMMMVGGLMMMLDMFRGEGVDLLGRLLPLGYTLRDAYPPQPPKSEAAKIFSKELAELDALDTVH